MEMERKVVPLEYYVWMSQALGIGNKDVSVFTDAFENPMDFYNNRKQFADDNDSLSEAGKTRILETSLDKAHEICVKCDKLGYKIFHYQHDDYPFRLKSIFDFPVVLYAAGNCAEVHKNFSVTMIGTRKPSPYAGLAARFIARDLALAGAVVTSGLAVGLDAVCHTGALETRGKTVAFMACGLDVDYPKENKKLRQAIEQNGMIYSEHTLGARPEAWHFPIRNRLLSGFSDAVMLVEGRQKSGSMHTVKHGIEQGKDIFALPGDIFNINSMGAFSLIRDGATPVMSAMDILKDYEVKYSGQIDFSKVHDNFFGGKYYDIKRKSDNKPDSKPNEKSQKSNEYKNNVSNSFKKTSNIDSTIQKNMEIDGENISTDAKAIYNTLKSPTHIEELMNLTGIHMEEMVTILTKLELDGYIICMPGKIYKWRD